MTTNNCFYFPSPNPAAPMRLFCFPFAGGDNSTYIPWAKFLGRNVELVIVQLPGRGHRIQETSHTCMDALTDELYEHIADVIDLPYIFFGHSMGAKVAYELACKLHANHHPLPLHFVVSGSGAPFLERSADPIHQLPDDEFLARIERMNGTPPGILSNEELMQHLLPVLRADFSLTETYRAPTQTPLPTDLTLMFGSEDAVVHKEEVLAWQEAFDTTTMVNEYSGGHFFIHDHMKTIARQLAKLQ